MNAKTLYPNLSRETAALCDAWLKTPLDQSTNLPMPWVDFATSMEKQRDNARAIGEQLATIVIDLKREIERLANRLSPKPVDDGGPAFPVPEMHCANDVKQRCDVTSVKLEDYPTPLTDAAWEAQSKDRTCDEGDPWGLASMLERKLTMFRADMRKLMESEKVECAAKNAIARTLEETE